MLGLESEFLRLNNLVNPRIHAQTHSSLKPWRKPFCSPVSCKRKYPPYKACRDLEVQGVPSLEFIELLHGDEGLDDCVRLRGQGKDSDLGVLSKETASLKSLTNAFSNTLAQRSLESAFQTSPGDLLDVVAEYSTEGGLIALETDFGDIETTEDLTADILANAMDELQLAADSPVAWQGGFEDSATLSTHTAQTVLPASSSPPLIHGSGQDATPNHFNVPEEVGAGFHTGVNFEGNTQNQAVCPMLVNRSSSSVPIAGPQSVVGPTAKASQAAPAVSKSRRIATLLKGRPLSSTAAMPSSDSTIPAQHATPVVADPALVNNQSMDRLLSKFQQTHPTAVISTPHTKNTAAVSAAVSGGMHVQSSLNAPCAPKQGSKTESRLAARAMLRLKPQTASMSDVFVKISSSAAAAKGLELVSSYRMPELVRSALQHAIDHGTISSKKKAVEKAHIRVARASCLLGQHTVCVLLQHSPKVAQYLCSTPPNRLLMKLRALRGMLDLPSDVATAALVARWPAVLTCSSVSTRTNLRALGASLRLKPAAASAMAVKHPSLLASSPRTLRVKMGSLAAILDASAVHCPMRTAVRTAVAAPMLLNLSTSTLRHKFSALGALLGMSAKEVASMVAVKTRVLLFNIDILRQRWHRLTTLAATSEKWSGELKAKSPSSIGYCVCCSDRRIARLSYVASVGRQHSVALYSALAMADSDFERRFPGFAAWAALHLHSHSAAVVGPVPAAPVFKVKGPKWAAAQAEAQAKAAARAKEEAKAQAKAQAKVEKAKEREKLRAEKLKAMQERKEKLRAEKLKARQERKEKLRAEKLKTRQERAKVKAAEADVQREAAKGLKGSALEVGVRCAVTKGLDGTTAAEPTAGAQSKGGSKALGRAGSGVAMDRIARRKAADLASELTKAALARSSASANAQPIAPRTAMPWHRH